MRSASWVSLLFVISKAVAEEMTDTEVTKVRGYTNVELCQQIRSSLNTPALLREVRIRSLICTDLGDNGFDYSPAAAEPSANVASQTPTPTSSTRSTQNESSDTTSLAEASGPIAKSTAEDSVVRVSFGNTVGSGFYLEPNHVVTNAHVVGNANYVTLAMSNGAAYSGRVIYRNGDVDFGIIETDTQGLPVQVRKGAQFIGEGVMALGYPQGRTTLAASTGTIRKVMPCCIIHDALIAAGSSGGPLVDQNQEVIGLNTLISKAPGDETNSTDRGIALRLSFIRAVLLNTTLPPTTR